MATLQETSPTFEDSMMDVDHLPSFIEEERRRNHVPDNSVFQADADPVSSVLASTPFCQEPPFSSFSCVPKRKIPLAEQPILEYLPQRMDLAGKTMTLEVVYTNNPASFYCQLSEAIPLLDSLMEEIAADCEGDLFFWFLMLFTVPANFWMHIYSLQLLWRMPTYR